MNYSDEQLLYLKYRGSLYNNDKLLFFNYITNIKGVGIKQFEYPAFLKKMGVETENDLRVLIKKLDNYYKLVFYSYNGVIFKIGTYETKSNETTTN